MATPEGDGGIPPIEPISLEDDGSDTAGGYGEPAPLQIEEPEPLNIERAMRPRRSMSRGKIALIAAVGATFLAWQQGAVQKIKGLVSGTDDPETAGSATPPVVEGPGGGTPSAQGKPSPAAIAANCTLTKDTVLTCVSEALGEPLEEYLDYVHPDQQPAAPKARAGIRLKAPDGKVYFSTKAFTFTEDQPAVFGGVNVVPVK